MIEPDQTQLLGPVEAAERAEDYRELREQVLQFPKWASGSDDADLKDIGDWAMKHIVRLGRDFSVRSIPHPALAGQHDVIKQKHGPDFEFTVTPGIGTFEGYVGDGVHCDVFADGGRNGTPIASDLSPAPGAQDLPLVVPNGAEYILTLWSAFALGCTIIPISPRNLANKDEVIHMIQTALKTRPDSAAVVIADDIKSATAVDELGLLAEPTRILLSVSDVLDGWTPFERLMPTCATNKTMDAKHSSENDDGGAVLFTSGTTSMPKGIFTQRSTHASFVESWANSRPHDGVFTGSKFCCVLPNNHSFAHYMIVCAQSIGAAIVYPGPGFEANTMLETLHREKITQVSSVDCFALDEIPIKTSSPDADSSSWHTVIIPTIIHALIEAKATHTQRLHLTQVIVGGAVLSPDFRRSCMEELGAKSVENWYGMTEGLLVRPGNQGDVSTVVFGDEVSIGWVMPGYSIRIADPSTNKPVPRNEGGELHGSCEIITRYIGGAGADNYYNDADGRLWFKSGDQARMDNEGRLFITGRYKEIIIRGGTNISPAAIETAIRKDPSLASLNPQVVGASDAVAGEVPVAVILGEACPQITEAIQQIIRSNLGSEYVLDDIISARDLSLSDYPRTMAGKIQKTKLAELIKIYRAGRDKPSAHIPSTELASVVRNIWAKTIGLDPSRVPLDRPVGDFADSLTVMRVRSAITRQTGQTLSIADITGTDTIAGHIKLLQKQSGPEKLSTKRPVREGPPGIDDMIHLLEDPELLEPTKKLVVDTISPFGLDWIDVEDVVPAYDFFSTLAQTGIMDNWRLTLAILTKKTSKADVIQALKLMFANNRFLVSFMVWDNTALRSDVALHVAMRQTDKLFDIVIHDGGKLKTVDEIKAISGDISQPDDAIFPGPLTRATLYHIEETGTTAVIIKASHSTLDASSAEIFRQDLDDALGGASLEEHVDFKAYADSYYNFRTSAEARASAKWHIKRLKGIESHTKALEQPFPVPKGTYENWTAAHGRVLPGHAFEVPGLDDLRREHKEITAPVLLKAAFALVQVYRTGHTHALFQNFEASRTSFPFLPRSLATVGELGAGDMAGPSIQMVYNILEIDKAQSVLALLDYMQTEQTELTRHAAAPFRQIMEGLGPAGKMLPEIFTHEILNWLPALGGMMVNPYENMEVVHLDLNPACGIGIMAGLGGPDSTTIFMQGLGQLLDLDGFKKYMTQMEKVMVWLADRNNWKSPAGEFATILEA
ncbi:hypothetical protein SCAR479_10006 [Seiridium cardinale]|uniref:Carrier domain-containing protein n=1 Tax=Seiridium cardinale TaxID=138064 RepID=A0ABR2XHN5_9PEZI